jgi:hypothetical protein
VREQEGESKRVIARERGSKKEKNREITRKRGRNLEKE